MELPQTDAPTMPIPGAVADAVPAKCSTCKHSMSVGLQQPLDCRLNPPHLAMFLVPDAKGQPTTFNVTKYPQVGRNDVGCWQHAPKAAA